MSTNKRAAVSGDTGRRGKVQSEGADRGSDYNTPRRHRLAILDRLDGLRETGPDTWRARCPAHGSRGLSLSVRDAGDRILLHCFAGCGAAEILDAVGLELADLFDSPLNTGPLPHRDRLPRVNARDVLAAIRSDLLLLAVCVQDTVKAGHIDEATRDTIAEIAGHLLAATEVAK